ncbi:COG4705 family protein [Sphingomonas oryzagri]
MTANARAQLSKVPAVTLGFWGIKILATTLGETGGDTASMTMGLGYLVGTAIFATILVVMMAWQIKAARFHPALYWATIIASTTAGTTMADYADRSLGIGYLGGSTLLLGCVALSLLVWKWALGSISVETVRNPRTEIFYWITITFSQTLGTALGDWTADSSGLGYLGGATLFAIALAVLAALYAFTSVSRIFLFWAAFILTRPLGATVGDFLDKPLDHGGLAMSRPLASLALFAAIAALIAILPQRAGSHPEPAAGRPI